MAPAAAQNQQPTAPPPKEEGPRSFGVFLSKLAQGEAELTLSSELFNLSKRLQEEAVALDAEAKGTLTLKLSFAAEPKEGLVKIGYEVTSKPPKPRRSTGFFWHTKGGNLSPQPTKPTNQTAFGFQDVANAQGIPHDLNPDHTPPREV